MSLKCNVCGAINRYVSGPCVACGTFGSLNSRKMQSENFTEDNHDGKHYDRSNRKYKTR